MAAPRHGVPLHPGPASQLLPSRRGTATVGTAPSPDLVLGQLAHLAAVALDFEQGRIILRDPAEGSGRSGSTSDGGWPAGPWARLDSAVRERGTAVVLGDVTVPSSEYGPLPLPGAYVGVPIWGNDAVVGVLRLTDAEPRPIPVRQVRVLVEFSRTVGLYLRPDDGLDRQQDRATAELSRALAAGEIIPWYQPVVDLATDRVVGVEALARWVRPEGQVETPAVFIPVAERSDLIIELDFAVMRTAMADLARWQRIAPDFRLSVNLSGRHLDRPAWLSDLVRIAETAGVDPTTIDLELTETARPSDVEKGWVMVEELRHRGFTTWFDDFGTGYYDLQDLVSLPVDGLKIDRSFADHLDHAINDAVVGALIAASKRIGIKVVIEGIETPRQAELARALGCDLAQGFHWSRPVPGADVAQWLTAEGTG